MKKCASQILTKQCQISKILFSIIFLLLLSCASGPKFIQEPIPLEADPNLYLYRQSNIFVAAFDKWLFFIDGSTAVGLANGTYVKIPIKPGNHEVMAAGTSVTRQRPLKINFVADKGKNIYVKYEIDTKYGVLLGLLLGPEFDNYLLEVDENQALVDLKELRLTSEIVAL